MFRLFTILALLSTFLAWPSQSEARCRGKVRGAVVGAAAKTKGVVARVLHRAAHPLHGRCK